MPVGAAAGVLFAVPLHTRLDGAVATEGTPDGPLEAPAMGELTLGNLAQLTSMASGNGPESRRMRSGTASCVTRTDAGAGAGGGVACRLLSDWALGRENPAAASEKLLEGWLPTPAPAPAPTLIPEPPLATCRLPLLMLPCVPCLDRDEPCSSSQGIKRPGWWTRSTMQYLPLIMTCAMAASSGKPRPRLRPVSSWHFIPCESARILNNNERCRDAPPPRRRPSGRTTDLWGMSGMKMGL